jgi:hypothetical protein
MVYRLLPVFLLALALALCVNAPVVADDKDNTHEGTVVSVTADKLVMKADGKEHEHTLAKDAKITCDGKECKLEELKPGMKVRVTTKKGDNAIATKIQALDKNTDFEK